ncbi:MAG: T9SS type A sorting domain-containing protein [Cytophagaceae bacterium]
MMEKLKRQVLIVAVFAISINISCAQDFAPIGAKWYYSLHGDGMAPPNSEYALYESVKDTIILERTAKKITRQYFKYNGSVEDWEPYFVTQIEDTVFLYNPIDHKYDRLYIFNASKGDTLTLHIPYKYSSISSRSTFRVVVDSVAVEVFNEQELKKYRLFDLDHFNWISEWYMDKAGGLDWFTPRGVVIPEAGMPMRCYVEDELEIHFVDYSCDYRLISSVEDKLKDSEILIFPNPTEDVARIKTDLDYERIEIYNSLGSLLKVTTKDEIDLSGYMPGVYVVKMYVLDQVFRTVLLKN